MMREEVAKLLEEGSRLSGFSVEDLLGFNRKADISAVRVAIIRAAALNAPLKSRVLCAEFNRERTHINYAAGKKAGRIPKYDEVLFERLDALARQLWPSGPLPKIKEPDPIPAGSRLGRKRKGHKKQYTISQAVIDNLVRARTIAAQRRAERGCNFKTEETRLRMARIGREQLDKHRFKATNAALAKRRIPEKGDPLIKKFFQILRDECISLRSLEQKVGLSAHSMSAWGGPSPPSPMLLNIRSAFEAVGWKLTVTPIRRDRP